MLVALKKELAKVGVEEEPSTPTFRIKDPNAGIVSLHHNGVTVDLMFSFRVVSFLQRDFGKPGYLRSVATYLEERDVDGLADLISRASGRDTKDRGAKAMSLEDAIAWSPPIVPLTEALNRAWLLALFGPSMRPEEGAGEKPSEGKLQRMATFWKSLFAKHSGRA
jgi:hypothetical protein